MKNASIIFFQKQPFADVYRPQIGEAWNFIKKWLRHRCFPVKFEKYLFLQSTSSGSFSLFVWYYIVTLFISLFLHILLFYARKNFIRTTKLRLVKKILNNNILWLRTSKKKKIIYISLKTLLTKAWYPLKGTSLSKKRCFEK